MAKKLKMIEKIRDLIKQIGNPEDKDQSKICKKISYLLNELETELVNSAITMSGGYCTTIKIN